MFCSISSFGSVLLFLIVGAFFALISLSIGKIFRPNNPTKEKLTTYECGEETIIGSWGKFNIHFYLMALIFVLFEVEIIFLFPWARILTDIKSKELESYWEIYAFMEGILFIFILIVGLSYLWKNKLLDWQFDFSKNKELNFSKDLTLFQQNTDMEKSGVQENESVVPNSLYEKINTRYS